MCRQFLIILLMELMAFQPAYGKNAETINFPHLKPIFFMAKIKVDEKYGEELKQKVLQELRSYELTKKQIQKTLGTLYTAKEMYNLQQKYPSAFDEKRLSKIHFVVDTEGFKIQGADEALEIKIKSLANAQFMIGQDMISVLDYDQLEPLASKIEELIIKNTTKTNSDKHHTFFGLLVPEANANPILGAIACVLLCPLAVAAVAGAIVKTIQTVQGVGKLSASGMCNYVFNQAINTSKKLETTNCTDIKLDESEKKWALAYIKENSPYGKYGEQCQAAVRSQLYEKFFCPSNAISTDPEWGSTHSDFFNKAWIICQNVGDAIRKCFEIKNDSLYQKYGSTKKIMPLNADGNKGAN